MLSVDSDALRAGLERAHDAFRLHHLSPPAEAEAMGNAVLANFGIDDDHRSAIAEALLEMLPSGGDAALRSLMSSSMGAGVVVGLLIADAALPATGDPVPDHPPLDL